MICLLVVTLVLLLRCLVSSSGSSELTSESCTIMHWHSNPPANTRPLTGPLLATRHCVQIQSHCGVTFTACTNILSVFEVCSFQFWVIRVLTLVHGNERCCVLENIIIGVQPQSLKSKRQCCLCKFYHVKFPKASWNPG